MRIKKPPLGLASAAAMFAIATLTVAPRAEAQTVKVIHSFRNLGFAPGGYNPSGGLIFDSAGNLYGTDQDAGKYNGGTVYELVPNGSGGWTQKVLYNFDVNTKDGYAPYSNVVFDAAGNLYGTTNVGGAHNLGTVYKLTPGSGGVWTEQVLHSFGGGTDGTYPTAGLIVDAAGNLYGTASQGGTNGGGIAFELKHASNGSFLGRYPGFFRQSLRGNGSGYRPNLLRIGIQADAGYGRHVHGDANGQVCPSEPGQPARRRLGP